MPFQTLNKPFNETTEFTIRRMNYHKFKEGDLVYVEYGNRPLGIIYGEPKRRYPEERIQEYCQDGKWYSKVIRINPQVNYFEIPVLISDTDETRKHEKWYWPGGLYQLHYDDDQGSFYKLRENQDPLIAYIHPSYLTFVTER